MLLKPPELTIDPSDPYANDAFDRKGVVEAVARVIDQLSGPFVMAIDSPWGTGKTTFIRMLQAQLEADKFACMHFNAWETDFAEDPLIAFMGEMDKLIRGISAIEADRLAALDKAKKIAGAVAKRAIPAAIKVATLGAVDLAPEIERAMADATGALADDAVDRYLKDKALIEEFRGAIDQALSLAEEAGKRLPLVIFVDELDRCRPLYAIELLERIKHIFNVRNAIFILAIDKEQLGISLSAVYGTGFNSREYLRRFFDLEFRLAQVDSEKFCESLLTRMKLNDFFVRRSNGRQRDEEGRLKTAFRSMAKLFELSPRAQEQYMGLITLAMKTTAENQYFHPEVVAVLAAIKVADQPLYERVARSGASIADLIQAIEARERTHGKIEAGFRPNIVGGLLGMRADDDTAANTMVRGISDDARSESDSAQESEWIMNVVRSHEWRSARLALVVKRVDLAAQFA